MVCLEIIIFESRSVLSDPLAEESWFERDWNVTYFASGLSVKVMKVLLCEIGPSYLRQIVDACGRGKHAPLRDPEAHEPG